MLVITRTNLAQSFAPIVGKNGKSSATQKRVASTLSGIDAGQATFIALTGSKTARETVLGGVRTYDLTTLCATQRIDFGALFAQLGNLWGFTLPPVPVGEKGSTKRLQCERMLVLAKNELSNMRVKGDAGGYTERDWSKCVILEGEIFTLESAFERDTLERDAAVALKESQTLPV
jgi:hypothetical protein